MGRNDQRYADLRRQRRDVELTADHRPPRRTAQLEPSVFGIRRWLRYQLVSGPTSESDSGPRLGGQILNRIAAKSSNVLEVAGTKREIVAKNLAVFDR